MVRDEDITIVSVQEIDEPKDIPFSYEVGMVQDDELMVVRWPARIRAWLKANEDVDMPTWVTMLKEVDIFQLQRYKRIFQVLGKEHGRPFVAMLQYPGEESWYVGRAKPKFLAVEFLDISKVKEWYKKAE